MNKKPLEAFWNKELSEFYALLKSSPEGLSEDIIGLSSKEGKRSTFFQEIYYEFRNYLKQFTNPLMLLLIAAVILSAVLNEHSEMLIILTIVMVTGTAGYIQEFRAHRIVKKLRAIISRKCRVIRAGKEAEIELNELLQGDVLVLHAGDIIAADSLIIKANSLQANESTLSGESFPVLKSAGLLPADTPLNERTNVLWEGTSITSGSATALVINKGEDSVFGSIIRHSMHTVQTTFDKGLKDFGLMLMKITLILGMVIFLVNLYEHKPLIDAVLFALALAVGMAPELLPAVSTIAMSSGARRMLDKKVVVKELESIQNLGEVNLICTDKTGTITEGKVSVDRIIDLNGMPADFCNEIAYNNAFLQSGYRNPIDDAIVSQFSQKLNVYEKIAELPFDFQRRRLSIIVHTPEGLMMFTKGAFNECKAMCQWIQTDAQSKVPFAEGSDQLNRLYESLAEQGERAIALCYKKLDSPEVSLADEAEMTFAGLVVFTDHIKQGVPETIQSLKNLNLQLKIITGDSRLVAVSVARQIGIVDPVVISSSELSQMNDTEIGNVIGDVHIFAEVEPAQKEALIQHLRKKYSVAYLGDGINDVPAIEAADVGLSVSNATEVAKEAADFILLEQDLSVIVEGIIEGRKTFANTLKYIFISTGSTFGNMCSVALSSLFLPFLPMQPKQILLTNFMTDLPFLTLPSDKVDVAQLQRPGKWDISLLRRYMLFFGIHSSLFDMLTFATLLFVFRSEENTFQSGWFVESTITELLIFFVIRTRYSFYNSKPSVLITTLNLLVMSITLVLPWSPLAGLMGLVSLPLNLLYSIIGLLALYFITADLLKGWFFRTFDPENR